MAVCGPRPLLVKYLPLYNEHQARRHEVRPGFTGLAQVNGRNSMGYSELPHFIKLESARIFAKKNAMNLHFFVFVSKKSPILLEEQWEESAYAQRFVSVEFGVRWKE